MRSFHPSLARLHPSSANRFFSTLRIQASHPSSTPTIILTPTDFSELANVFPASQDLFLNCPLPTFFSFLDRLKLATDSRQSDLIFDLLFPSGGLKSVLNAISFRSAEVLPQLPTVFLLLRNIVRSSNRNSVFAIQSGALDFCLQHFFTRDESINTGLRKVFSAWIESSEFPRALLYSCGILHRCVEALSNPNHFPMLEEWSGKLLLDFMHQGPTSGQTTEFLSAGEAQTLWNDFRRDYYFEDIFNEDRFFEFITIGLDLSAERPTFHLLQLLLQSRIPTAVSSLLQTITILVDRDDKSDHPTARSFLNSPPIALHQALGDFVDLRVPVVWETLMSAYAAIYYAVSNDVTVVRTMVAQSAFELIGEASGEPDLQGVVVSACHALANIFGTEPSIVPDVLHDEKWMEMIDALVFEGSFKIRSAGMWLFLEVITNGGEELADANHVRAMCELIEGGIDKLLIRFIIQSLGFLFEREEGIKTEGRPLVSVFDDHEGFRLVCEIEENTDDEEVARLCHDFWEKHNPDPEIILEIEMME